jgi:hypothetical protein
VNKPRHSKRKMVVLSTALGVLLMLTMSLFLAPSSAPSSSALGYDALAPHSGNVAHCVAAPCPASTAIEYQADLYGVPWQDGVITSHPSSQAAVINVIEPDTKPSDWANLYSPDPTPSKTFAALFGGWQGGTNPSSAYRAAS